MTTTATPTHNNAKLRILITGSRDYGSTHAERVRMRHMLDLALTPTTTRNWYWLAENVTVVHGGARGADQLAHALATELGMNTEVHPAAWDEHGKAAGFIRNQHMVDLVADLCLAFPLGIEHGRSRGTQHAMAAAKKAGIPVQQCSS